MKLPIPQEALAQHVIALGKTRSGKSSKLRLIVEALLDADKPVCVIDPKGDWWGLKSSADGKSAGFPVVIFGGEHADVPINEHAGAHVAELVATGNRPCVIDLGGWMVGERTRFFISFASALFKLTRGERYLVIDEVHNFAPQGKILDPDAGKMLHWANRLASEGSGKGITLIAASQRPQKTHKDFVTSCETLLAMRVVHKLDRDAIKDWIDGCGDPEKGKEVLTSLAGMQRSEGWVWSPEIGFGPKIVAFPLFRTYDSFRPQHANAAKLKGWAEVNLDDVRSKLAAVVEHAKQNDPAALKRRIAELERQLNAKAPAQASPEQLARAQQRGFDRGHAAGFTAGKAFLLALQNAVASQFKNAIEQFRDVARPENLDAVIERTTRHTTALDIPGRAPAPGAARARQIDGRATSSSGNGARPPVQQRILDSLAALEQMGAEEPDRELVAFMAGYSNITSKGFANAIGALSTEQFVAYPRSGSVTLTENGRALANPPERPQSSAELQERIVSMLGGATARVLKPLIDVYPKSIPRDELAEAAGYGNVTSKGFANAMGRLRTLGFIDYPDRGHVVAQRVLFLE